MREFEGLSRELKALIEQNSFLRGLLGTDVFLILGGGALMIILSFTNLFPMFVALNYVITILSFLAYYGFILGLIFAFANNNTLFIYGGFAIMAVSDGVDFLSSVYHNYFSFYSLLQILLFAYLAYAFYTMEKRSKAAVAK